MRMERVAASDGFRLLSGKELSAVSGGAETIVVTGTRPAEDNFWMREQLLGGGGGFEGGGYGGGIGGGSGFGGGGGGGIPSDTSDEEEDSDPVDDGLIDSDGDGEIDTIVVTGPERVELGDGKYAYVYDASHYDIYDRPNWILSLFGADDKFVGHYTPDANGAFTIKDSETSTTVKITVPVNSTPITVEGTYTDRPQTEFKFREVGKEYHHSY